MMEYENWLQGARCVFHLGTFLILMNYKDPTATGKPGISALAIVITFVSGALGMLSLTGWNSRQLTDLQLIRSTLETAAFGVLFLLAAISRGNVARMLPRNGSA